jgi:GGDEF domain-containing protein/PAS domain-containing protein
LYELPAHEELLHNPSCTESRVDSVAERLDRSGLRISVRIHRSPIRDAHGEIIGILERAHVLAVGNTCSVAEAHLCLLVEQIPLFFWTTDSRLHITSHWGRTASLLRSFPRYPVGQTIHQYLRCQEDSEPPVKQHILALRGIPSRLEYASRNRIYDLGIGPYRDPQGLVIGCIGMALDITERKKTEDEIRFRASHDGLTGLANYREFFESLEREVRRAERTRQPFALLLLDLDDLKHINDRHGHLTGNRALNRLARVMKEHCRGTETAAHYGGDEFAILLLTPMGNARKTSPSASAVVFASKLILRCSLSALVSPSTRTTAFPRPNSWKPPTSASTRARNPVLSASPRPARNAPSPRELDLAPRFPDARVSPRV